MDQELQRIHDNIRRIIDGGGPERDVLAYLRSEGYGSRDAWMQAWTAAQQPQATEQAPAPQAQGPQRGASLNLLGSPHPVGQAPPTNMSYGDANRLLLQALPLVGEYMDEALGDTERIERIRQESPGSALAAEMIGASIPVGAGARLVNRATTPLRKVATGAAVGGITGLIEGMGLARGSMRERALSVPAVVGGAVGAAAGGLGGTLAARQAVRASESGAPGRFVEELQDATGIRGRTTTRAFDSELADQRQQLSGVYRSLDTEFQAVNDPALTSYLNTLRRDHPNTVRAAGIGEGPPTFDQLKDLRGRLDRVDADAKDVLTGLMDEAFQGSQTFTGNVLADSYRDLTRRYQANGRLARALDAGRQKYNSPARDIAAAMEGLSPEEISAFRAGQASRVMEVVGRREEGAVSLLRQYVDAGPDQREIIRMMFPPGERGDVAFRAFSEFLRAEKATTDANTAFRNFLRWARNTAVAGAAIGGAGYGVSRIGGDN